MSKKLQEKQRKRLAEQMRKERQRKAARRSNLITIGIAVVVVAGVTAMVLFSQTRKGGDNQVPEAAAGVSVSEAGCDDIQEHPIEGREHITEGTDLDYKTVPPTSGNHWPTGAQADPGFYTDTVEDERLVHNMEHGQVIIWYSPDASQDTIDGIKSLVESADDPDNPQIASLTPPLIGVPYDQVPASKTYAITAWGASQACTKYSEAAINAFRTKYQGRGPEQATAPFSG